MSLSSMTFEYSENVTVIDEYNSAVITNNGTKAITVEGKGYNATLNVVNEAGEVVTAAVTLGIGTFFTAIIDFVIIAFCIFLLVKGMTQPAAESIQRYFQSKG